MTKSRTAKFVAGVVGFAMALSFVVTPVTARAATSAELQAQINTLLATIQSLQAQLSSTSSTSMTTGSTSMTTGSTSMTTGYTFNTNLTVGSKGTDVMNLQKVLNMSSDTMVAVSGTGSAGMESTYFGNATKAAVMKFQTKYGIKPVAGYVGAITRAKLNSMSSMTMTYPAGCTSSTGHSSTTGIPCSTGTTTTTTTFPAGCTSALGYSSTTGMACSGGTTTTTTLPTGGSVSVTAGAQPTNSLAPQGAARIPFTNVTLTAGSSDVTVNSITVERSGLAQDAVFSGIVLLDQNGIQIGIAKTLNSNHQAMVGDPFVVKAGTSMMVTIAGNMATNLGSYPGQVAGLNVVAVNTSATVAGSFPIMGAQQTINASLALGTATLSTSSFDPGSLQNKEIGSTGYKFSSVRVTAGSAEQVKIWSIRFNQSGSASSGDLANVMVYVDGTGYPTTVSADGKYYIASFPGGLLLDKGNSKDLYIQGDIVGSGAAGRTIQFDIYKTTDIYLTGVTYGYGITPTATAASVPVTDGSVSNFTGTGSGATYSSGTPFFSGAKVTVTAGAVTTIQKATSVAAQNIAVNVPNQVLGGYDTNFRGEPISVQGTTIHFATTSTSGFTGLLTNITIVDSNGAVVAGPVDAVAEGTAGQKAVFTDTITYPIGARTYTIKGRLASTFANNATIVASFNPYTDWSNVTGQTTGNSINLTGQNSTITLNTVTVKSATLAISVASTPSAQSIVAGGQGIVFANYQFDASQSGEDVRFSSLPVKLTVGSGAATSLNTCQLYDGSVALNTGSNVKSSVVAGDNTFTLDSQLVIPKGTIKTLTLKCNVASGVTGAFSFGIQTAPTVTGVNSSNSVTTSTGALVVTSSNGQLQTIGNGSLVVSTDSSSPSYIVVAAGSTGNVIGAYKFRASNEAVNLNRLGLKLTSGTASDLVQVSIWNGSTQVGTATFTGTSMYATSTFATPVVLAKDTDTVLTVKADLASVGTSQPGTQGDLIKVDFNGADTTGTQGTGYSSGSTINATGSTSVAGIRLFRSFPTLALDTLPTTGLADGRLMHFKVTANSNGSIGIQKFTFQISTTSSTVTQVALYAYNDSSYSNAISGQGTSGQIGTNVASVTNGTSFNFTATNPVQVSAGATVYFELRASVAGVTTGSSVVTTLVGDAAYPTVLTSGYNVATSSALTTSNFVWSGNATSTSGTSDVDFSNGYGLPGFPSSGLFQTRSN